MNKVSTPPKKVMPTTISTVKKVQSPLVTPRQSPLKSSATTPVKAEVHNNLNVAFFLKLIYPLLGFSNKRENRKFFNVKIWHLIISHHLS